jgi:hypothetical protein
MMKWYLLTIGLLAAWRITHLLQAEDGPFDLIYRLRKVLGSSVPGKMMDCFNCLSLWVAMPFAYFLADSWLERILLWLALSGGAILLERITRSKMNEDIYKQHYKED